MLIFIIDSLYVISAVIFAVVFSAIILGVGAFVCYVLTMFFIYGVSELYCEIKSFIKEKIL